MSLWSVPTTWTSLGVLFNSVAWLMVLNGDGADWENMTISITISSPPTDPIPIVDTPPTTISQAFVQMIIGLLMLMVVLRMVRKSTEGS